MTHALRLDQSPPEIRFIRHYCDHPDYIAALADSVLEFWAREDRADKLLMSFHGIPEDYATAGDAYPEECRHTAKLLAQSGIQGVQLLCPGFSADCLETLEEIQVENRDIFIEVGGRRYEYIPCLNVRADHISLLVSLVRQYSQLTGSGAGVC